MVSDDTSPAEWRDGVLRSRRHGDIYFSTVDGLAETRTVFLAGCGLPDAWRGRRRFTVGEIGFGAGLNIAALLHLWRRERPAGAQLHIFSIEAEPLCAADAVRALGAWPELADIAALLTSRWPGRAGGLHRMELPEVGAVLDVFVGEAGRALDLWEGRADAWFLDGFSPALNPDAWRDEVMALVAARSRPGARAATFTAAGHVRRALQAAGFTVGRAPGFAGKRHRLEATLPGAAAEPARAGPVAIIGAGIAGAALNRALAALGIEAQLYEATGPGAGASGNPIALVTPRLDAGLGTSARMSARAFARAARLYADISGAITQRGVIQLMRAERDARRFAAIVTSDLFEPGSVAVLDAAGASARLGDDAAGGLLLEDALAIEPRRVLAGWAGDWIAAPVARLSYDGVWRLLGATGVILGEAARVVIAAGWGGKSIWPDLPVAPIRGQMSFAPDAQLAIGAGWGGYAAPGPAGVAFGATYDRGRSDTGSDPRDDERNLDNLRRGLPCMASRLSAQSLKGRASIRAVTPDREPIAGALGPPGLYALTGLGSRGFSHAPLLAEHVAALIAGAPSPLAADQAGVADPSRPSLERAAGSNVG